MQQLRLVMSLVSLSFAQMLTGCRDNSAQPPNNSQQSIALDADVMQPNETAVQHDIRMARKYRDQGMAEIIRSNQRCYIENTKRDGKAEAIFDSSVNKQNFIIFKADGNTVEYFAPFIACEIRKRLIDNRSIDARFQQVSKGGDGQLLATDLLCMKAEQSFIGDYNATLARVDPTSITRSCMPGTMRAAPPQQVPRSAH